MVRQPGARHNHKCRFLVPSDRILWYIFPVMTASPKLKDDYILANCCRPELSDRIVGYYSHVKVLKVHRVDCANLQKVAAARLVVLVWDEILAPPDFRPDDDYAELDETDFAVLEHHERLGIDYSLKMARDVEITKEKAFDRHHKLRDLGLLERVDATMVQYRKNVVAHKWIKHRNHTYYDLTDKGRGYLAYFRNKAASD